MEQEVRHARARRTDLIVIKVKTWKIGRVRLKFFTDRKAFLPIGTIGRRSAILSTDFFIS